MVGSVAASTRVAFTIEQCWHRVPGGTATAALALGSALDGRDGVDVIGVAARHRGPPPSPWQPTFPVRHLPLPRPVLYEAWARVGRPHVERATGPVQVVHATTIIVPPRSAPLVVTIHDLAFLHDPSHFTRRGVRAFQSGLARVRRSADVVLCSSSATADDCERAGVGADRLRVVPLGVEVAEATGHDVEAARRRYGLSAPYLLFVGTVEPRKNLDGLLAAFARLVRAGVPADLQLALVGPAGWGPELETLLAAAEPEVTGRVRRIGFVPEAVKRALLAGAAALCYPSRREGFGLPVLEAMAQGTPVVTSRGTSTEEVAGGAAVLVDPTDPDDIASGIVEALRRRRELAALGRARAAEATWARTAALTRAAYAEVAR